jgi:ABC-2 type transport system permease protein
MGLRELSRQVGRHSRVYRAVVVQAVRRDAQFRAQAWTTGVVAVAELLIGVVPVLVVTSAVGGSGGINGWSPTLMIAVAGCFQIAMSLLNTAIVPNLMRINGYVQRGELDGVLIRPIDPQWFTFFRWIRPASLTGALGGALLVGVGLHNQEINLVAALLAVLWFSCGCGLVAMLWANLSYLAFWLEAADFIHDLVGETLTAGRYPVAFFPSIVRATMIFVVPIGVATTLPIQALTDGVPAPLGAGLIVLTLGVAVLTRLHWRLALRRYASASS